jgi:Rrf2 family transcriptional regulator, nitric oxide-sensitive transcriptional repressor
MRLNLHTDYALRLLMYLAQHGGQASVDEVAGAFAVSRHHLMKVAQRLTALGYLDARRGRGGGISLRRSAAEINVGAVVRALEPTDTFVECFDRTTNTCAIAGACGLQGALNLALGDFLARLDRYSLAELVPSPLRFRAATGLKGGVEPAAAG